MEEVELPDVPETSVVGNSTAEPVVAVTDFTAEPSPTQEKSSSIIALSPPPVPSPLMSLKAPVASKRPAQATRTPQARTVPARATKRRARSRAESVAQTSESDTAPRPTRKRAKQALPVAASTRSLRSRGSKTEQQIKEEEEAKERIRRALDSDGELSD